jgi:NADH-quinone oxidoreductase subunit M
MYQRTFLGKADDHEKTPLDLRMGEWAPALLLITLMLWLGSYTQSFMPPITSATGHLLDLTSMSNEYRVELHQLPHTVQIAEASHAR